MHKNMHYKKIIIDIFAVTFREEGVDWNAASCGFSQRYTQSPSARKVWIEIQHRTQSSRTYCCHLPRGRCGLKSKRRSSRGSRHRVTFREEGVDWNGLQVQVLPIAFWSPSARKVWIEMWMTTGTMRTHWVTFREEGVDWNRAISKHWKQEWPSPSARKVWIEINQWWNILGTISSPSARKVWIEIFKTCYITIYWWCHLPRGRCGLKFMRLLQLLLLISHLPRGRCGLKLKRSCAAA